MQRPILAVVVPCYNEEEVLPETSKRLEALLARLSRCLFDHAHIGMLHD